jgi:hypothetical protein
MIRVAQQQAVRKRFRRMAPVLDEQSRRRFTAAEAQALGRGGVSLMARITGLARRTIYRGLDDIRKGRVRKKGDGRKKKVTEDPTLLPDLKRLVEPTTRGDPTQPLLWTSRSLGKLAKELAERGHKISPTVISNLVNYSLRANLKTREGTQHIDRDTQFQYINSKSKSA